MQAFDQLSYYDFERLVADLLSAKWSVDVDTFPRGRDGGVDLRVLGPTGGPLRLGEDDELVVQCKHFPLATMAQLRSPLRKEAAKPAVAEATRYVLVTSARLTRANKTEIANIFSGRVREADVLGCNDVEGLLCKYPEVERAHPKLWMTNAAVLESVLHKVEHVRSMTLVDELMRLRATYVETPTLSEARTHLDREGICVLTGPPGVGKSTTAYILIFQLIALGWHPIVAIAEVQELEKQLQPGVKQVLFFDDFLGRNSLEAKLRRGEESELLRLIRMIRSDRSKCLILTTRDYVLRQAQQSYEQLADSVFDAARVTVRLVVLSQGVRAHILYNQLYFSDLREAAAAAPNRRQRYMELVRHPKYNPRIIQEAIAAAVRDSQAPSSRGLAGELSQATGAFTSSTEAPQADPAGQGGTSGRLDVPLYLRRALDEPSSLWNHILRYQLTETQRWLLLVRASFGQSPVYLEALYDATVAFCARHGRTLTTADLDAALAVLNGDLLSVSGGESRRGTMVVEEVDPGVADAIIRFLDIHHDITWRLIETATYFTQVQWLAALLGVVNRPAAALQPSEQIANHAQVKDLMVAAERTLLSDSGVTEGQARVPGLGRPGPFLFFGTRLQLLSRLYAIAGGRPRRSLPDEVIPKLVAEIEEVDDRELLQLLRVLRREMPSFWHSRRTDVEVATLRMLDEPVDADGWDYLREVLNIVPTTGEYEEDLTSKLEAFLEAQVDEARDEIEDGDLGMDKEDLLDELERIANSWDVSADIDGVRDLLIERREAAEPEEKPEPQRESLFDYIVVSADQAEKPATADGSIFDRL